MLAASPHLNCHVASEEMHCSCLSCKFCRRYDRSRQPASEIPIKHKSPYKSKRFRTILPKMDSDLPTTPIPATKQIITLDQDPPSPTSTVSSPPDEDNHLPDLVAFHSPALSARTMAKPLSRPPSAQLRPASVDGVRKPAKQPVLHTFLPGGGSKNKRTNVSRELGTFMKNGSKKKRAHVPGGLGTFMPTVSRTECMKTPEQPKKKLRHRYAEVPEKDIEMPDQVTGRGAPLSYSYGYGQPGACYAPIGNWSPATTLNHLHEAEMRQGQWDQSLGFQPIKAPLRTIKPSVVPEGMVVFVVGARCGVRGQPTLAYKLPKALVNQYCPNIYYLGYMLGKDYFELPFVVTSAFDKVTAWMEKKQFPHNLVKFSQTIDPYAVLIDIYDLAHWLGINVLKDECLNAMEWMRLMSNKVPSVQCLNRIWRSIVRDRHQGTPHQGIEQMFIDWYMALVPNPREIPGLEAQMEQGLAREPAIALLLAYADAAKSGKVTEMAKAGIYHQTNEAREMPCVRGHPRNGLFWDPEEVKGLKESSWFKENLEKLMK